MTERIFDELHIVSDLHLGGPKGAQIFSATHSLSKWISTLTEKNDKRIGLIINGDIFDFLADEKAKHFDPTGAISKLDAILDDFHDIVEALRAFASGANCHLVLVIGNHDVELALPYVQNHLINRITNDEDAQSRIHLAMDGRAFECKVGDRVVHCVHGNAGDDWNVVNYERVSTIGREVQRGHAPSALDPNAGTRLVIDVMNTVKRDFPFVDLLKPEGIKLVAIVLALDPSKYGLITDALGPYGVYLRRKVIKNLFLSGQPAESIHQPMQDLDPLQRMRIKKELMTNIEQAFEKGLDPMDLVYRGQDRLGFTDWISSLGKGAVSRDPEGSLRRALRGWVEHDRTFDFSAEDEVFEYLDGTVAPEVDFIVAGHTHIERALRRTRGKGVYFNSGTWIRLVPIHQHFLASAEAFHRFFEDVLKAKSLDTLEPYELQRRTVVSIWKAEDGNVLGELQHVRDDGTFVAVEGSRLDCLK